MKRPKRVTIYLTKTYNLISSYTCPHCKTEVHGAGINRPVTRFLCSECDEECIVDGESFSKIK